MEIRGGTCRECPRLSKTLIDLRDLAKLRSNSQDFAGLGKTDQAIHGEESRELTVLRRTSQDPEILDVTRRHLARYGKTWRDLTGRARIPQDLEGLGETWQELTRLPMT